MLLKQGSVHLQSTAKQRGQHKGSVWQAGSSRKKPAKQNHALLTSRTAPD
jgi:hypothetical protein